MGGKASAKSKNAWNAKAYDRIQVVVKKGDKDRIKEQADRNGQSVNSYITSLISEDMKKAGHPLDDQP